MKKLSIIEVWWRDSAASGGWKTREAYQTVEPSECRTAGYLLKKTRTHITVVQSQDDEGKVSDSMNCTRGATALCRRPERVATRTE